MRLICTFVVLLITSSAANAQNCIAYDMYDAGKTLTGGELVVTYIADISVSDTHNSKGVKLSSAGQVLRQDRANFHKYGAGGSLDTYDAFFGKSANRGILETARLLTYCNTDFSSLARSIVQGNVPGVLDVMVFKLVGSDEYVLFINVVG